MYTGKFLGNVWVPAHVNVTICPARFVMRTRTESLRAVSFAADVFPTLLQIDQVHRISQVLADSGPQGDRTNQGLGTSQTPPASDIRHGGGDPEKFHKAWTYAWSPKMLPEIGMIILLQVLAISTLGGEEPGRIGRAGLGAKVRREVSEGPDAPAL